MREDQIVRIGRGHRADLDRYARLLATNLSELERQYIHRRVAEEHAALSRLEAQQSFTRVSASADAATLVAAREAARRLGDHPAEYHLQTSNRKISPAERGARLRLV